MSLTMDSSKSSTLAWRSRVDQRTAVDTSTSPRRTLDGRSFGTVQYMSPSRPAPSLDSVRPVSFAWCSTRCDGKTRISRAQAETLVAILREQANGRSANPDARSAMLGNREVSGERADKRYVSTEISHGTCSHSRPFWRDR